MAEMKKIPERAEIALEDTWAVEDLYPSDEAWEADRKSLVEDQKILAAYAGRLGESAQALNEYLTAMEQVDIKASRLGNYASRMTDVDTRVAKYQAMSGSFRTTVVALSAALSFETPEIMAIPEETLERFYADCPELTRYRRYLTNLRRLKEHVLSPAEEKLLAAAGEMAQVPSGIYGAFSNADLTFPDAVDGEGKKYPLSHATFVPYEESQDRELRRSAYETFYHTLSGFRNTTAAALNAQNRQQKFFADARKYPSTLDAALSRTNVPTSVYRNLIEAVHQNMDKMHRYVRLRKKLLGVDELHFYDVYAPLLPGVEKEIPFAQAKEIVYDALYPLGDHYRSILKEGFENRWIDVYHNAGKRSGAYSAGAAVHPYVLLNYAGTLDNVFTLAHEMGHALHSWHSNKYQNPIDADYVIFVAEVASTCNEALMMQYMLAKTTDQKERAALINQYLEKFKGTLFRQTMFAEFELNIGRMAEAGTTLTADVLCAEYKRLNALYFGPDMVMDDEIAMEWARIPHFYYNYYVFQYATGFSAAIALSRKILSEGEIAVKDYIAFLSGGCSKSPIDLLKGAGVDMTTPDPVNQALALFGELVDEMDALTEG